MLTPTLSPRYWERCPVSKVERERERERWDTGQGPGGPPHHISRKHLHTLVRYHTTAPHHRGGVLRSICLIFIDILIWFSHLHSSAGSCVVLLGVVRCLFISILGSAEEEDNYNWRLKLLNKLLRITELAREIQQTSRAACLCLRKYFEQVLQDILFWKYYWTCLKQFSTLQT